MTELEMLHFLVIIVHSAQLMFYDDCDYPYWYVLPHFGIALSFVGLFAHFYIVNYLQKEKIAKKRQ